MKKTLCFLFLALCCIFRCWAQHPTETPKLQELDDTNAISTGATPLSAQEKDFLIRLTSDDAKECRQDSGPAMAKAASELVVDLRVERVQLTPKGDQGLVIQGSGECLCSPTGNCEFWVIGEKPYLRVLLDMNAIQTFAIEKTQLNGYFDLALGMHGSATETELKVVRFKGKRYRLRSCADMNWADADGNPLKSPQITPEHCN